MGGMRDNQGGRQPENDEPGPAELQQQQHKNKGSTNKETPDLTSSEADEARLKGNYPERKRDQPDE